jgi:hypothetical protein
VPSTSTTTPAMALINPTGDIQSRIRKVLIKSNQVFITGGYW